MTFSMQPSGRREVIAKTSSYTITDQDMGKVFTTRGASTAVTFTLPAAANFEGESVWFINVADENMIVAGQDEEIVALNDLTADSVAYQTTSEKVGGGFWAFCDGTSWLIFPMRYEAQTVTVASA